ncbi:MAG TPA: hypothetical protein VIJ14_08400, partial [Rhabdochlamydiaceae bacterium]
LQGGVQFDFPWQYHGASVSKMRRVTFITADITTPDSYPALLKAKIEKGFDIFYMKGAFVAPAKYPQFLPYLAKSIQPGGWLMTADKTMLMELFNPEPCLEQRGLVFTLKGTEEARMCQDLMRPPFDPFAPIPVVENSPDRRMRTTGTDLSYWSILSLRQKNNI